MNAHVIFWYKNHHCEAYMMSKNCKTEARRITQREEMSRILVLEKKKTNFLSNCYIDLRQ